jgi:acetylornithine deacetylase/succinyl-diaminopimelate desuccinylase-like protein
MLEARPLMQNADERVDVSDLALAARFYFDIVDELVR